MAKMMKTAERALHKRTNKMLASATKRYKKFMRQAARRQATINAKSIWPRLSALLLLQASLPVS